MALTPPLFSSYNEEKRGGPLAPQRLKKNTIFKIKGVREQVFMFITLNIEMKRPPALHI